MIRQFHLPISSVIPLEIANSLSALSASLIGNFFSYKGIVLKVSEGMFEGIQKQFTQRIHYKYVEEIVEGTTEILLFLINDVINF